MVQPKAGKPLILFDLVATLTDAGPRYAAAFKKVCEDNGIEPPDEAQILQDLGNKNLKQIIDTYAPGLPLDKQAAFMDECNECCDAMLYNVHWHERLFPNVRNALKDLNESGYALGIYTGTRDDALESQLQYHNIGQYFDSRFIRAKNNDRDGFVNSDDLKNAQLQSILDSHANDNEKPGSVIVVGDSASDYAAASKLGLRFVGFAPNETKEKALRQAGAQRVVSDFADLGKMVDFMMTPPSRNSRGPKL